MKVVVTGSRSIAFAPVVNKGMDAGKEMFERFLKVFHFSELVSGNARGVDRLAELWAERKGIPVKRFIPDWNGQGKKAGILRNQEMADYGNAVLAIWDGESRGTKHMIEYATEKGMLVFVRNLKTNSDQLRNYHE